MGEDFLALEEQGVRAVAGPKGRHAALIEDAFHVMVETPGGGVRFTGDSAGRAGARRTAEVIAERARQGFDVGEVDERSASRIAENRSTGAIPRQVGEA